VFQVFTLKFFQTVCFHNRSFLFELSPSNGKIKWHMFLWETLIWSISQLKVWSNLRNMNSMGWEIAGFKLCFQSSWHIANVIVYKKKYQDSELIMCIYIYMYLHCSVIINKRWCYVTIHYRKGSSSQNMPAFIWKTLFYLYII
jgi:hypothetical protein